MAVFLRLLFTISTRKFLAHRSKVHVTGTGPEDQRLVSATVESSRSGRPGRFEVNLAPAGLADRERFEPALPECR